MLMRIPQLPMWCMTNINPALYDSESLSVVEQTGKIYAKMQALIDDYNKFAEELNIKITKLVTDVNIDQEKLETELTKLVHDYIIAIDSKIGHQDRKIEEFIEYVKADIGTVVTDVINEMKESGELTEELTQAFENLGVRITKLETDNINNIQEIESLSQSFADLNSRTSIIENEELVDIKVRVTDLENSKIKMIYDESSETILFENIIEEVQ